MAFARMDKYLCEWILTGFPLCYTLIEKTKYIRGGGFLEKQNLQSFTQQPDTFAYGWHRSASVPVRMADGRQGLQPFCQRGRRTGGS